MMSRILCAASFAGGLLVSVPALATPGTVGSATLGTQRSCSAVSATELCDGNGPGQLINARLYGGGVGVGGLTDFNPNPGSRAWADVRFSAALDLPEIRAATMSAADARININSIAFQTYTWRGGSSGLFTLSGALDIVNSSNNPTDGALPGGAIYSSYVGIWDPAIIAGLTTPEQLFSALFYAPCGTAGVLGASLISGDLPGGAASFSTTTAACAPGSLILSPGQSVLVVAGLQLPVNRGGWADASSTFTTRLGDDLTVEQKQLATASLVSAISQGAVVTGVPEPSSWSLLIAGFGLTGAALRRRRAAIA